MPLKIDALISIATADAPDKSNDTTSQGQEPQNNQDYNNPGLETKAAIAVKIAATFEVPEGIGRFA